MTPPRNQAVVETVAYSELLRDIKDRIRSARVGPALAVNRALIELYWGIGEEILRRECAEGGERR